MRRARILLVALVALLVPAAVALAAQTAKTGPAVHVQATTADLSGTVNPGGQPTDAFFQYGTTDGYGTSTAATAAGAGTADVAVEHAVTGLQPRTTYHYRIVARSGGTDTFGADRYFTTAQAPRPTLTDTRVASRGSTSAELAVTVNPNGAPTTVVFDYGSSTGYGKSTPAAHAGPGTSPVRITATIHGLQPRQRYHFRARASNSSGERVGPDRTFRTVVVPTPRASTVGVIQMQPNSAVVVGRVDPRRQPGTAFAEYGTTKQLGSRSAAISVNGGRQRVEIPLTGLTPQVRYWVRAVIQTAGGTVRGRRQSFVTPSLGAILVSPWPVPYGHAATLQGRIRGSGTAFARVALEGTPFPYTTPLVDLGAATQTDRLGNFTMQKVFRSNAQIRIRAEIPGSVVFGPQSKVRVRPIVRRRIRRISGRRVRISGTIRPPGAYRVSVRRGGRVIKRARSRTRRGRTRYRLTFRVRRTGNYTVRAVRRDRSLVSYTTRAKRLRRR